MTCNVLINVGRSESEAKDALSGFKTDNEKLAAPVTDESAA